MQIIFLSATKGLWLAQYENKVLVRHTKFEPEQNIFQPLEGQGITDIPKRAGIRMPKYNIWLYKESSKQFYPRFSMFCSRIRHCRKIYGISIHSYSVVNFRM